MKKQTDSMTQAGTERSLQSAYELFDISDNGALGDRKTDLHRVRVSGKSNPGEAFHQNMSDVVLEKAFLIEADLSRCDIKDCLIRDSEFRYCSFNGGAFATDYFLSSIFVGCTFADTSVINSDFYNCEFHSCDLKSLFMKGCRLVNCTLIDCHTDNKAIESSLFFNTELINSSVQIQMILENFGLSMAQMPGCDIRSARVRDEYHLMDAAEIADEIQRDDYNVLERLRLFYFVQGDLIAGGQPLDDALSLDHWEGVARIPASFNKLLQDFCEFLTHLYENNAINAHVILLLHSTLNELRIRSEQEAVYQSLTQTIIGIHVRLSRLVEEFLLCLALLQNVYGRSLVLVANGPTDTAYFERCLEHLLSDTGVSVREVVPHNSPVDVLFAGMDMQTATLFIALFLATRTNFEIKSIVKEHQATDGSGASERGPVSGVGEESLFMVSLGFARDDPGLYGLKIRSLMPGSLLLDFRLQVSTKLVSSFRSIVVKLMKEK